MSKLAKDVATELDRRRRRRRIAFASVWTAAIVALLLYLRCGQGWGIGGKGAGEGAGKGPGSGSAQVATPKNCTVRVSSEGITVDGTLMTRDQAVAACKQTEGALVTVTGDARQGDWDELKAALDAAHVPVFTRDH
jgi:hypothetical protein